MKRNFIVFMTDHQRGDTMLADGPAITPNIDRFRSRSVTFREAYCPAPHCCPSRATFFSGLYPSEHGVWNNVEVSNALSRGLFDGVRLFPEDLRDAGYRLWFSGKWHVSAVESPADRGFEVLRERVSNFPRGDTGNRPNLDSWSVYKNNKLRLDGSNETRTSGRILREGYPSYYQYGIDENPYDDAGTVADAIGKLDESGKEDQPFFLYVGTTGPHDPYFVPQRFLDMYNINDIRLPDSFSDQMQDKPALYRRTRERYNQLTPEEHRESIRRFLAFCSYEDSLFGELLDAVDRNGLTDSTTILYLSDHGDYMGAHGLWAKGLPCFREAYNICAMVGGAGVKNPGWVTDLPVSLADFAPTILELAELSQSRNFSGRSLCFALKGTPPPADWRTEHYTQTNGNEIYGIQRAVFNRQWKYVFNSFDYDELYNLVEDPWEIKNLARLPQYAPVVRQMCALMWQFARAHGDNCSSPYIMTALAPYGPGINKQI